MTNSFEPHADVLRMLEAIVQCTRHLVTAVVEGTQSDVETALQERDRLVSEVAQADKDAARTVPGYPGILDGTRIVALKREMDAASQQLLDALQDRKERSLHHLESTQRHSAQGAYLR